MGQDELMKSSFDANIGTVGTTESSSVDTKLDQIIDKLSEINNTLNKIYNIEPEVKEEIPEVDEEIINEPVVDIPEEQATDMISETPVTEAVAPAEETTIEDETFTPINVDVMPIEPSEQIANETLIGEPKLDEITPEVQEKEVVDESNVMPIDEILASEQTVEPIEEPSVEVPYEAPVVEETSVASEPIVTPIEKKVEEPVVAPIEETPISPVTEAVAPVEIPDIEVTPASDLIQTTDEVRVEEQAVSKPVVTPIETPSKGYKIVSDLYVGMTEAKTGETPHRVIPVEKLNDVFSKENQETKALVMNKIA